MAHPHPPRQSLYPTSAGTSSSLHSSHSQPSQNPSSSSTTAATAALQRISARDLTESQIRLLNASQCLQFTDQLDQELLSLMQSLDGHFLRATRTVTDVLLPSIEKYGENSRDIWDAVKYFKTFFEVAAGIRLTDPTANPEEEEEAAQDDSTASRGVFDASHDSSSSAFDANLQANTSAQHATFPGGHHKTAAASSAGGHSVVDQLAKDAEEQFGIVIGEPGTPKASTRPHQRMRDLSFDSPDNTTLDTLQRPELETMSFETGQIRHAPLKGGRDEEEDDDNDTTPPDSPTAARAANVSASSNGLKRRTSHSSASKLPQRVARTSTPARPKAKSTPKHLIPPTWSAARPTDLSKTPLGTGTSTRSYTSNATTATSQHNHTTNISDVGSPPTMTYAFSHLPSQIARTPGKQAAEWMTRDVYETAALQLGHQLDDSPVVEPPSVIKNWDKRNYGGGPGSAVKKPPPPNFGRVVDDDDHHDDAERAARKRSAGGVVDEDEDEQRDDDDNDDVSFGSVGDAPIEDWDSQAAAGEETQDLSNRLEDSHLYDREAADDDDEEEDSFAAAAAREEAAPDTLFGGKRDVGQLDRLSGFLRGEQNMHTLHGGHLLESQPFEASPLKGRDVRHGL